MTVHWQPRAWPRTEILAIQGLHRLLGLCSFAWAYACIPITHEIMTSPFTLLWRRAERWHVNASRWAAERRNVVGRRSGALPLSWAVTCESCLRVCKFIDPKVWLEPTLTWQNTNTPHHSSVWLSCVLRENVNPVSGRQGHLIYLTILERLCWTSLTCFGKIHSFSRITTATL